MWLEAACMHCHSFSLKNSLVLLLQLNIKESIDQMLPRACSNLEMGDIKSHRFPKRFRFIAALSLRIHQLQSNQEKRTPQDYINELNIWILKPLVVSRIRVTWGLMLKKINIILFFEITSEFNIKIINTLMLFWGVRFTWFNCKRFPY